ncbi:hypothetical protein [Bartonella henselae]|uniref:hypothetical protein n=1 Tax=Bartonella henselae TaxID=38323 RepID=UPI001F39E535|nr:hypothetical protein [Bartonella henselae]UJM36687.1 hypothetical protein KAE77_01245 [Bartonella henselae]
MKASVEDIAEALDVLEGGLTMQKVSNAEARAKAYITALNGISLWALLQAVKNLVREKPKACQQPLCPLVLILRSIVAI